MWWSSLNSLTCETQTNKICRIYGSFAVDEHIHPELLLHVARSTKPYIFTFLILIFMITHTPNPGIAQGVY